MTYHTCGGMMPILEQIAGMGPDAMETFTPPDMGGDVAVVAGDDLDANTARGQLAQCRHDS